jgi:WD40 repeat protein
VTSAAFSPDGTRVASGAGDGVRIWNVRTGKLIGRALTEHKGAVSSVAFSADGGRVVSGSGDGTLRFWDAHTGQPVGGALEGHEKEVESVAFSRDGRRVASGSADGTVRLWPAPGAWPDVLCEKLNRNMTARQWREWVSPEIEYVKQCPDLPIPADRTDRRPPAGPAAR